MGLLPNVFILPTPPFIAEVPPTELRFYLIRHTPGPRVFFSTTNPYRMGLGLSGILCDGKG